MYLASINNEEFKQNLNISLKEYRKITYAILNKLKYKFSDKCINKAIHDEDMFSECIYAVMKADSTFNKCEKGNLMGWRFQSVIWTLQTWLTKINRKKNKVLPSLNFKYSNGKEFGENMSCRINLVEQFDNKEELDIWLSKLKPQQSRIIKKYYLENYNLQELSEQENLCISRIHDIIHEGLEDMRYKCLS